jgi:thiamine pyrophosphokinase
VDRSGLFEGLIVSEALAFCRNWKNSICMNHPIVDSLDGVTLVGGGPVTASQLARARALAPRIVGADGGADRVLRLGAEPEAVIGDMDSISPAAKERLGGRLFPVGEQDTTDFDKALRAIAAPFVLGLGFAGARSDHGLAVLNSLVRHPTRRCFILGSRDVTFLCPPELALDLPRGARLSLYPMGPVTGRSEGLRWPLEGLNFAPDGMIGTSNVVTGPVRLRFTAPKMLVILPVRYLPEALRGCAVM